MKPKRTKSRIKIALCASMSLWLFAAWLLAASTNFTEPFASGHGWTYVQTSCNGTCTNGDVSGDGNPSPSIYASVAGRNKNMAGYFKKTLTWENLGVPAGDTVETADGQWDDKAVPTAVACNSNTLAGVEILDSADSAACTDVTLEPNLNVSGDTAGWTNHNPTGAVSVSSGCTASSTTITLRFHLEPAAGNNGSAACELRGDNFKLTVVSSPPAAGAPKRVYVSRLAGPAGLDGDAHAPALTNASPCQRVSGLIGFQKEIGIGGNHAQR
jgi:hypothetical protein